MGTPIDLARFRGVRVRAAGHTVRVASVVRRGRTIVCTIQALRGPRASYKATLRIDERDAPEINRQTFRGFVTEAARRDLGG